MVKYKTPLGGNTQMKKSRFIVYGIITALSLALVACGSSSKDDDVNGNGYENGYENGGFDWAFGSEHGTENGDTTANANLHGNQNANDNNRPSEVTVGEFNFSEGLDENGFFEGVIALNYVGEFSFNPIVIPHTVYLEAVTLTNLTVDDIVSQFAEPAPIYDRAVQLGDDVNIDFDGFVEGVPFDGGSSGGFGFDLLIGSGQFIPGFEEQLIGAMPGDVVNVELAFPEFYPQAPHLAGVDVVFVTAVNFINGFEMPELDDEFAETHLYPIFGWATVDEMRAEISEYFEEETVRGYIENAIRSVAVTYIPQNILTFFENMVIEDWRQEAEHHGLGFADVLELFEVDTVEDFLAENEPHIRQQAEFYIILQAIAEDMGITVTEADLEIYFIELLGVAEYAHVEEMYGRPYIIKMVRSWMIFNYIFDNAVFN